MMNNNSFKNQLSAVSKSRDEVLQESIDIKHRETIESAKQEYENLKREILDFAKCNGYLYSNNKRTIYYHYKPKSTHARYVQDNGIVMKKSIFNGYKLVNTNVHSVKPHPSTNWEVYYNELQRLCSKDEIEINAVVYNTISKKIISNYPISKYCTTADFCCIEVKISCKVEF